MSHPNPPSAPDSLAASQVMEGVPAVGLLASGMARGLNHLLVLIVGYAQLLQEMSQGNPMLHGCSSHLLEASQEAVSMTRHLEAFSQAAPSHSKEIAVNATILELRAALTQLIGPEIELVFSLAPDVGTIRVDPTHIQRLVLALAVLATNNLPDGGRWTISTRPGNLPTSPDRPGSEGELPGVLLSMREESRNQARTGRLTITRTERAAMVVSIAGGVVRALGGQIDVQTGQHGEATIEVWLPASGAAPRVSDRCPAEVSPQQESSDAGCKTIVVLDNDARTIEGAQAVLGHSGFRVLVLREPQAVLVRAADPSEPFDLLLADVAVSNQQERFLQRFREARPHTPTVYMAAMGESSPELLEILRDAGQFLLKPFPILAMARMVRTALSAAALGRPR